MKTIITIIVAVIIAVAVNYFIGSDEVTRAHFDKRINDIEERLDSIKADVAKVWNVSRETRDNTDSIKTEVRGIDAKIDVMQKDITDIKATTQTIEFRLF